MKILVKDIKQFDEELRAIDEGFKVDVQFWVIYGKPAARKIYKENDYFIELAIYYNYKKDLVAKITKNRIISENENAMMSTPVLTIKEDFAEVKQASKKNILEKVRELKNIDLKQYI